MVVKALWKLSSIARLSGGQLDQFEEGKEACNFLDHSSMKLTQRLYFIPHNGTRPTV
jgi:hypothetical protein